VKSSLDEVLIAVWRQAMVENADAVKLGKKKNVANLSSSLQGAERRHALLAILDAM
jgi:hypothetical protein